MAHHRKDMLVPALVGTYSVAGLLIGRSLKPMSSPLSFEHLLVVGGTSAAAAYVSPMITHRVMCPWLPTAPLVNAAVSSALLWAALRAESVDPESAAMFVPVQMASSLLAEYVAHEIRKQRESAEENNSQ